MVKNLIELTIGANLGDLTSLEELVGFSLSLSRSLSLFSLSLSLFLLSMCVHVWVFGVCARVCVCV